MNDHLWALLRSLIILAFIALACVACAGIAWVLVEFPWVFFVTIGVFIFGCLYVGQLREVRDKD